MHSEIITTPEELHSLVATISSSTWLAIDTEFMRESSYYPMLCLIQIATENTCNCIDVFAVKQLDPLIELLKTPSCTKIFHSARQDLEVLFSEFKLVPTPIFDTQIAASMLGPDEQISYGDLVEQYLTVRLAKTESRTDWSKRPLSKAQIHYALDDVRYLGPLHQQLSIEINNKDRRQWLDEECIQLAAESNYKIEPDDAWKNVKGVGKAQGNALEHIQRISYWREQTAQSKNRPRQWILKDRAIIELSHMETPSVTTINDYLETEYPKSVRHKDAIVELLLSPNQDTSVDGANKFIDRRLTKSQQSLVKQLMQHIRQRAQEMNMSSSLLANRKSIEHLVLGRDSKVISGWRKSEIGEELVQMVETASSLEQNS